MRKAEDGGIFEGGMQQNQMEKVIKLKILNIWMPNMNKIITGLFVNKKQQQCVKLHVWEEKSINGRNNQI